MTSLTLGSLRVPTAPLGPVNPLPPIGGDPSLAKTADLGAAPEELRANAAYGRVASITPYLMQDGYGRHREDADHPVAVLENDHLRATFLLNHGGRLWSLIDRESGRELLHRNPILQPANLALRNAWFAGGVEWNIGTIGHTPLTCAPLHAAQVTDADGSTVLRLYEFERLRRLVYQLDIHLPADSRVLYVHIRVTNPNDDAVPLYWWSNIAIPQREGTRVLAPADRAWSYSYDSVLRSVPVSDDGSDDVSYPARFPNAADYFFELGTLGRPWIAAVDERGAGIFQTSTDRLRGRKLFRWGTSAGGSRWQEWLSGPDSPGYAEIQAGLASTQFEHLPLPGATAWSWTEAYGALRVDGAHLPWPQARDAAAAAVIAAVPDRELAAVHAAADALADRVPDRRLWQGSGWGALDRRLRERAGEPPLDLPGAPFDDATLTAEQQPWLELLETGVYPEPDVMPCAVVTHPAAIAALDASPGWAAAALAGVARAAAGDWAGAAEDWQTSLNRADNAFAHRNLAVAAGRCGDHATAAAHYRRALTCPGAADLRPLVIEAMDAFLRAGQPDDALLVHAGLAGALAVDGRIRLCAARASYAAGDLDRCAAILDDVGFEVADLREGEDSLDELFFACRTALAARERSVPVSAELRQEIERTVPLPAHLDFRMS